MPTVKLHRKSILEATKKHTGPIDVHQSAAQAAYSVKKSTHQADAERESRRQGLRLFRGLNAKREGGPVDGLQFQEKQRAEW